MVYEFDSQGLIQYGLHPSDISGYINTQQKSLYAKPMDPKDLQFPPWLKNHPLVKLLKRFTYKPHWTIGVDGDLERNLVRLMFLIETQNSYPPHDPNKIIISRDVPAIKDVGGNEEFWQFWLLEQLRWAENHEMCEWFTVDGKKPYDPHKNE